MVQRQLLQPRHHGGSDTEHRPHREDLRSAGRSVRTRRRESQIRRLDVRERLMILIAILLFSLACWISERSNKPLGIDTYLNLILPIIFTASVLGTFLDWLSLATYRHFGLNQYAVFA